MFGIIAGVTAGASLISGYMGAEASEDAAHAGKEASDFATRTHKEMYDATRADLAPYRDAGAPALQRLMYLTGLGTGKPGDAEFGSLARDFTLGDFAKDPGYAFRQEEGEKAITRGAMARGLNTSSATLKNLMRYNQGLASSEYGAAYGRFEAGKSSKFNLLSYLSGTGQNAAAMTGTAGTNSAAGISQAAIAGGQASAAGSLGVASSWNNAIQGGLGNYMYQQRWDQMMNRFPVFGGGGGSKLDLNAMAPS